MDFRNRIQNGFVILDGALGSHLQKNGLKNGECPERFILDHPDVLVALQKDYIEAGSDVIYAPTFTCNEVKLAEYGLKERQKEIIQELVDLSKQAVKEADVSHPVYIAGDITMTGEQLSPMGSMEFETLVDIYKRQAECLVEAGVDLFVVETMMSLAECRAALLAVKETCDLPVMVSMTFQEDGRSLYGTSPETAAIVLSSMGADVVGVNCSTGPDKMIDIVKQMRAVTQVPIMVKPNAGLPTLVNGENCYSMNADEWCSGMGKLIECGATLVGGCCGTTKEYIAKLKQQTSTITPMPIPEPKDVRYLTTERNTLPITLDGRFMVVGERINPTGKKELQEELRAGGCELVLQMAEEQVENGAAILDVNMGTNGIDEKETMIRVVKKLTQTVDVPLSIDSSYVEVVEAALRIYPGRALINSISLEQEKIEKLLPIAKKYGAMFVLLPLSGTGLPKDMDEKKKIIHTILEEAEKQGLGKCDVIVDGLVTTIGANKEAAKEVLETIRYCYEKMGLATICGLSNISFGLPERIFVNTAFLTTAIQGGLTMAIANPQQTLLMNAALATDLLMNKKDSDIAYIEGVKATEVQSVKAKGQAQQDVEMHPLMEAVVKGRNELALKLAKEQYIEGVKPSSIIDNYLIPAINHVGELFEKKKYYLPQLIASAEAMEHVIQYLQPMMEAESDHRILDTIVMATVHGDIHDIGKNLVVLMLRNYGYRVIDLGKDVESEEIIRTAKEEKAAVIGLSALMTTTMMEMDAVVKQAREQKLNAKIIIGGAVVTESFAEEIGADGYSKDAREAVKLVNRLLGHE